MNKVKAGRTIPLKGKSAGMIILAVIFCTSFLWAGLRPSGFAFIHIGVCLATSLSLRSKPLSRDDLEYKSLWISWGLMSGLFLVNYLVWGQSKTGWDSWVLWIDCGLITWIVSRSSKRTLNSYMQAWFLMACILIPIHFYLVVTTGDLKTAPSHLLHAYHFGFWAILIIFPGLAMLLSRVPSHLRILGMIVSLTAIIYLLIDVKSSPLLVFFVCIWIFTIRGQYKIRTKSILSIVVVFFGFILILLFYQNFMMADLMMHIQNNVVTGTHYTPMLTAWNAAVSNPVFGIGFGNFSFLSGSYEPPGLMNTIERAHNSFLELLSETGFPGILILGFIIVKYSMITYPMPPKRILPAWVRLAIDTSLISAVFLGLLDYGLQMPVNSITVAFLAGMLLTDSKKTKTSVSNSDQTNTHFKYWVVPLLLSILTIPRLISGIYYDLGKQAADKGRIKTSISRFETANWFRPHDDRITAVLAEKSLNYANYTGKSEAYQSAVNYLDRSLSDNDIQSGLYFARAMIDDPSLRLSPEKKFEYLERAVQLDPTNVHVTAGLIVVLIGNDRKEQAMDVFIKASSRAARESLPYLADSLVISWDPPENLPQIITARLPEIKPITLLAVLDAWKKQGLDILSIRFLTDHYLTVCSKFDPHNWLDFAKISYQLKLYEISLYYIDQGLMNQNKLPVLAESWILKGNIYSKQEEHLKAIEAYDKASNYDPSDMQIHLSKVENIRKLKGDDPAFIELQSLVKRYSGSSVLHLALGQELERRGAHLEALYEFRQAANILPASVSRNRLEKIYQKIGIEPNR